MSRHLARRPLPGSGVESLGEVGDFDADGAADEGVLREPDPHGTTRVVPSPMAVMENVPVLLDVYV